MKVALFSGRFDPPNLGHVITINWLLEAYDRVVVCILEYIDRCGCSTVEAKDIFNTVYSSNKKVSIVHNYTHFAHISYGELLQICKINGICPKTMVYVGGNKTVNEHIKKMFPVEEIPRVVLKKLNSKELYLPDDQFVFESTRTREKMYRSGQDLGYQYNIVKTME